VSLSGFSSARSNTLLLSQQVRPLSNRHGKLDTPRLLCWLGRGPIGHFYYFADHDRTTSHHGLCGHFHQIGTRRGLFIFWTVATAILSWTLGKQLTKAVPRTDLEQFAALFIAVGLSSAIVLAILTILRKKQ
jgi:hypothetical protein